jgi:hypothetical protein
MRNKRSNPGEEKKKTQDNTSSTLELSENSKEFFTGLINQVSTSFDATT